MKNYDNLFLPIDNMEKAKNFYGKTLGLDLKFDFSDMGMSAFNVGSEEPAIILKDKKSFLTPNRLYGLLSITLWKHIKI